MARLSLLPDDIKALLARHPELELEITTKATEQIADGLNRKITRELVEKRVAQELDAIVTERVSYYQQGRKLTAEYEKLVSTHVRDAIREHFANGLSTQVQDAIRLEVKGSMPGIIEMARKEIKKDLRQLLREELAQLLLSK